MEETNGAHAPHAHAHAQGASVHEEEEASASENKALAVQLVQLDTTGDEDSLLLPVLPEEIWLLVLGHLDETSKGICMGVSHEWRDLVLMSTRNVIPRLFAEDIVCSGVALLVWQRDVLGRPFSEKTAALAAKTGNLEVLQYLRANSCPWGAETCALATRAGTNFNSFPEARALLFLALLSPTARVQMWSADALATRTTLALCQSQLHLHSTQYICCFFSSVFLL